MKKLYFFLFSIILPQFLVAQVPPPDAWYTFDESSGTQITDSSGSGNHAYWFNWNGEDPGTALRTGWRPNEGYRGGAGYFAGDHVDCEQSCSSGSDLIIFSAAVQGADCMAGMPVNNIFQSGFTDLTLAFWFKNDWNYLCESGSTSHTCAEDPGDCAWERAVLWSSGDGSDGIVIELTLGATVPAYAKVTINGGVEGQAKSVNVPYDPILFMKWVHFAIVFDGDEGAGTGLLSVYFDGEFQKSVATEFGTVPADSDAVVFGGETGSSVTGHSVSGHCWGDVDQNYPGCPKPSWTGTVRDGWPVRGWIDELAYWKNQVLTKEQIKEFARIGDTTGIDLVKQPRYSVIDVYPTLTEDYIYVRNLDPSRSYQSVIYNALGQRVGTESTLINDKRIELGGLGKGLYIIHIRDNEGELYISKFIVK
jgi:hypothetical protein